MKVEFHYVERNWWWNSVLHVLILVMALLVNGPEIVTAKPGASVSVVVLVSMKIRPYLDAVEGVADFFDVQNQIAKLHILYMDDYSGGEESPLVAGIKEISPHLIISIGPDAARFAWESLFLNDVRKVYAMVLNPDKILPAAGIPCGVPLNIPPEIQLRRYRAALPELKRIGLIYDPAFNLSYAKEMETRAAVIGLRVTHIEISSRKEIPELLAKHWGTIDALWFTPDRTVISEGLVQYIIKEAIAQKVAVIGYNRFFYENGASLSFVFNYREIGIQSARLGNQLMSGGGCETLCPAFDTWLNLRVTHKIGVNAHADRSLGIVEGP